MSTSSTHPSTGFDFNYFLAEIKRSEAEPIVALFEAAMMTAGFPVTNPKDITPKIASECLARARAKHAERLS